MFSIKKEFDYEKEFRQAVCDVARLISKDETEVKQLVKMFYTVVSHEFVKVGSIGNNFGASTEPKIDWEIVDNKVNVIIKEIKIKLPEITGNLDEYDDNFFHHYSSFFDRNFI